MILAHTNKPGIDQCFVGVVERMMHCTGDIQLHGEQGGNAGCKCATRTVVFVWQAFVMELFEFAMIAVQTMHHITGFAVGAGE